MEKTSINQLDYSAFKKHKSSYCKKIRHFFEIIILKFFIFLTRCFSLRGNQKFGRWIGKLAYLCAKKDRQIAFYQLEFCFPEKTPQEHKRIVQQCFQHFGQTLLEIISINRFRKKASRWIYTKNEKVLYQALQQKKGVILLFGHFGNWEFMPIILERMQLYAKAIAREINVQKLNDFLLKSRKSPNLTIIQRQDPKAGRLILQTLKNNEILLIGIDQDTKAQSVYVDFFGHPAKTPKSPATLATKFAAPVVSAFDHCQPDGTHIVNFELLSEAPYENTNETDLTAIYNQAIEQHIRQFPEQWAWFHRRWKNQQQ